MAEQSMLDLIGIDRDLSAFPQFYSVRTFRRSGDKIEFLDKDKNIVGCAKPYWSLTKGDRVIYEDKDGNTVGFAEVSGGSEYVDYFVIFTDRNHQHIRTRDLRNVPRTTVTGGYKKPEKTRKDPPPKTDTNNGDLLGGIGMLLLGIVVIVGFVAVAFALEDVGSRGFYWVRLFATAGLAPLLALIQALQLLPYRRCEKYVRAYCRWQVLLTALTTAAISSMLHYTMEQGLFCLRGEAGWKWLALNLVPLFFYAALSAIGGFAHRKNSNIRAVTDRAVSFLVLALTILVPVLRAITEMHLAGGGSESVLILLKGVGAWLLLLFSTAVVILPAKLVGDLKNLY